MISSSGTIVKGVGGFYTVDDGQREFTLPIVAPGLRRWWAIACASKATAKKAG